MGLSLLPTVQELVRDSEGVLPCHPETREMPRKSQLRLVSSPVDSLNRERLTIKNRARRPGSFEDVEV